VTNGIAAAKQAIECGNLAQAEQILYELLEFAPVETRAWKLLARTQRAMGHIRQGISSAKRALQLQNMQIHHAPPASVTLAKLLWQQGQHKQAKDMLADLLRRQPDNQQLVELRQQWQTGSTH